VTGSATYLWTARPAYLKSNAEMKETPIPVKTNGRRRGARKKATTYEALHKLEINHIGM